jgi:hypothetical protein
MSNRANTTIQVSIGYHLFWGLSFVSLALDVDREA